MFPIIFILLVIHVLSRSPLDSIPPIDDSIHIREQWFDYKMHHNLSFSPDEDQTRYIIFRTHIAKSKYLSSINPDAQWGISQFSHLSAKEFASKYLLPKTQNYSPFPKSRYLVVDNIPPSDSLPKSFDWSTQNAVSPQARNQGSVGSCYAFSAVEAIASQKYLLNDKKLPFQQLSPEQIVDCDSTTCGVFGGWPYLVYEYIQSVGGVEAETSYPYCAGTGACYPCMADKNVTFCGNHSDLYCKRHCLFNKDKAAAQVIGWNAIPKDEDTIQSTLYSSGPLSVALDGATLQFYLGGIVRPHPDLCNVDSLDHAVLTIGWGQETDIFGKVIKYWVVRNSWGSTWGHDKSGNFLIEASFGDGYNIDTCGIDRAVTLPKVSK